MSASCYLPFEEIWTLHKEKQLGDVRISERVCQNKIRCSNSYFLTKADYQRHKVCKVAHGRHKIGPRNLPKVYLQLSKCGVMSRRMVRGDQNKLWSTTMLLSCTILSLKGRSGWKWKITRIRWCRREDGSTRKASLMLGHADGPAGSMINFLRERLL
jgi:hypothetical protein